MAFCFESFRAFVFLSEFVGNTRVVNPYSEHGGEILIRRILQRCAKVRVSDPVCVQKSEHLRQPATNGLLSTGILKRDEKQRRLCQSDSTLLDRVLLRSRNKRLFDRFF